MKEKIDFNKMVYTIIAVLIIVIIAVAAFIAIYNSKNAGTSDNDIIQSDDDDVVYKEQYESPFSEIIEGDLPSESELAELGLEDVMQTNSINEQFNLSNYEIVDGGIKYNYLANAVTNGERLSITAKAMSEEEYEEMLPTAKAEENTIDDIDVVYNDRTLYYTVDETQVPDYVKKAEEEGNAVVRYGNSLGEILPMQQLMWYSDGIGYTLESVARNYTYDDMAKLAQDFFEQVK